MVLTLVLAQRGDRASGARAGLKDEGGNHGDGKATSGGPPQHQEGYDRGETQTDDCASSETHANGLRQASREDAPLVPADGDIENGSLTVDEEEGEVTRLHRIGEALKRRKIRDGLAV